MSIKGELSDGHEFIEKAIESGAVAVLCEEMPENRKDITYVQTTCTKQARLLLLLTIMIIHLKNSSCWCYWDKW